MAESDLGMDGLEPDTVLPVQHFAASPGQREVEPERRLMLAIVADAVGCFQRYATATRSREQRLFNEASQWIFEEEADWMFSFESICGTLGMSTDLLRQGLRQWEEWASERPTPDRRPRRIRFHAGDRTRTVARRSAAAQ
jgi:hypothetical protein